MTHLVSLDKPGPDTTAVTKIYIERCIADQWSPRALDCAEALTTLDGPNCESELTSEQNTAVMKALQTYLLSRPPSPGSGAD